MVVRRTQAITQREHRVLRALVASRRARPDGSVPTWGDGVNDSDEPSGVKGLSLSGVMATLQQKGFITATGKGRYREVNWASPEAKALAESLPRLAPPK